MCVERSRFGPLNASVLKENKMVVNLKSNLLPLTQESKQEIVEEASLSWIGSWEEIVNKRCPWLA